MKSNEKNIIVSVVTITYNHEKYIKDTIEGVLMQKTDFDVEFIISNDASTDKTDEVIQQMINRNSNTKIKIKYHNHTKNKGSMENFIWTLKQAQGKYIALCEGDDYWTDPYKLQKQVDFLEENDGYIICGHDRKVVDNNENIIINSSFKHLNKKILYTQCVVFKNVFPNELFFNFMSKGVTNADTFLFYFLEQYGKKEFLNFIGANYRIHHGSIWSELNKKKQYEKAKKSFKLMLQYFKIVNYKPSINKIENHLINLEMTFSLQLLEQKKIKKTIKHFIRYHYLSFYYMKFDIIYLKQNLFFIKSVLNPK